MKAANAGPSNRSLLCWLTSSSTATAHLHPQHPLPESRSPTNNSLAWRRAKRSSPKSKKALPHGWWSPSATRTGQCRLTWCGFRLSISVLVVPYWPKSCFESLFFQLINATVIFLRSCTEHLRLIDYILNIQYFAKIHVVLSELRPKTLSNTKLFWISEKGSLANLFANSNNLWYWGPGGHNTIIRGQLQKSEAGGSRTPYPFRDNLLFENNEVGRKVDNSWHTHIDLALAFPLKGRTKSRRKPLLLAQLTAQGRAKH